MYSQFIKKQGNIMSEVSVKFKKGEGAASAFNRLKAEVKKQKTKPSIQMVKIHFNMLLQPK